VSANGREKAMTLNVELVRERLPFLKVGAICDGAKDTDEMGGGAAEMRENSRVPGLRCSSR